jgi:putative flippase GtrA
VTTTTRETRDRPARSWRTSLATFLRSNVTSLLTTAVDFGTLAALATGLHVNYVLATWIGTVFGSLSNFLINRYWAFHRPALGARSPKAGQFARFALVQVVASAFHTVGVWTLTRFAHFHYLESKLIAAVVVYLWWNYPMNLFFVFRPHRPRPVN